MRSFIVKVQVSIKTTAAHLQMLCYNRDQSVMFQGDATDEVMREMRGEFKAFFYAKMDGTHVVLGKRAPAQEW